MKKIVFILLLCNYISAFAINQKTVYIAPQGNDNGTGSKDQPFLSLERALQACNTNLDTLFIQVAPGDYIMKKPLVLSHPLNCPIVIKGAAEQLPRFIGGIKITGWEQYKNNIYRAYIPEVKLYNYSFEQFYVNGRRATWVKTPNKDWFFVRGSKEFPYVRGIRSAKYATQKILFDQTDLKSLSTLSAEELTDVRFRFYHKWDITQKKVAYACPDSGFIYIQGKGMQPWNPISGGARYIMYGYKSALDVPGEWYLDRKEGYLYYIPREGEYLTDAECVTPTLHQWLIMKGDTNAPLSDIRFENISFQYAAYQMPLYGNEPMQAAATTEAAIELEHTRNICFFNCEMQHTGGYAIWLNWNCKNNRIDHCYLSDMGAGGIKIGNPCFTNDSTLISRNNIVNNSIITHAGSELPCGVGVAIFHASDNQITHNEISDLRYSGISVGWIWGYNHSNQVWTNALQKDGTVDFAQMKLTSPAVRNLIAYNHIHHIGWGELSDMGAVYTLGESHGTRIVNNIIHDVLSYDYGGWGLYTDEGSTGVEMSSNLVYRCKSGGFHQHYGKDNRIENNIFAFGHYYQAQYTRVENHLSFHFKHNIILQDQGETLAGPWEQGHLDIDYNMYWHLKGKPVFGKYTFEEWKNKKEKHSIVADPLFIAPEKDDYRFKSSKNIKKIRFRPFDLSLVGVYGSDEWKQKAQMPESQLHEFQEISKIRLNK